MSDKDKWIQDGKPSVANFGCGKPLLPCFNSAGIRIGVTHTSEDEDHHHEYFGGMRIITDLS